MFAANSLTRRVASTPRREMPKRKRVSGSAPLAPVNTTNEDEISPAHDSRRRSTREKHGVDRYKAEPSKLFYQPRFEFVPSNGWHPLVRQLNCKARNTLPWGLASDTARDGRGRIEVDESSLPEAPCPCWLLPVRDEIAEHGAALRREAALFGAGDEAVAVGKGFKKEVIRPVLKGRSPGWWR